MYIIIVVLEINFLNSDNFIIGYYVITVAASLLFVKDTKKRILDFKKGFSSSKYAFFSFSILLVYIIFGFTPLNSIPILNWSWLGYNIGFGPFADQGLWAIIPFIPILIYMFIHINYIEELYFRKTKKMVIVWALIHIAMGVRIHTALALIPLGFLFKYIYDKKGINHAYSMHLTTNIMVVISFFLFSFIP